LIKNKAFLIKNWEKFMAKAAKKGTVKVSVGRNKKKEAEIEAEAELIASRAIDNLEDDDLEDDDLDDSDEEEIDPDVENNAVADHIFSKSTVQQINERDVFEDAHRIGQARNVPVYFSIYKNSGYLARMNYPYDWSRLQKQFGEGHYKVIAKIDGSHQIITSQSQYVNAIESDQPQKHNEEEHSKNDPLMWLNVMKESNDKAKSEAQEQAQNQQSQFAMMMQTMMQAQQSSQQQMQMMMMEMNKQAQAQLQQSQALTNTLITTMLSKKSDDGGFNAATVLKMVQDAESRGEARTNKMYELVDKKAEELAELKAESMGDGEESESTVKTLIKNFVPVITQAMNQNQTNQAAQNRGAMTAQQEAQLLAQRANQSQGVQNRPAQVIAEGRAQNPNSPRPNVGFADERKVPLNRINPIPQAVHPKIEEKPLDVISETRKDVKLETKEKIFELVKGDIGQALIFRKKAGETAQACLKKLENNGFLRQTVKETLTLEDYLKFAKDNNVPDMAKPWIEEFYAEIQKSSPTSVTNGKSGTRAATKPREASQDPTN